MGDHGGFSPRALGRDYRSHLESRVQESHLINEGKRTPQPTELWEGSPVCADTFLGGPSPVCPRTLSHTWYSVAGSSPSRL